MSLDSLRTALSDRYRIERELGAGGMATVYLAQDIKHGRQVAIKVLRDDLAASMGPARFLQEIAIVAQLQHPHIVPLLDSGEAAGLLYYVMPYIPGQSLRDRLTHTGALPIPIAIRLLREMADALSKAHASGLVHRDIKPENIMLNDGHALVMDFGIARAVSNAAAPANLTQAGSALGTPAYMAPEQAVADPHVDARADAYSLGVVAYEMLTGSPPFSGATARQVIAAHVTAVPADISTQRDGIPPELAALVMRCLAKHPADRPQTAHEIVTALDTIGQGVNDTPGVRPSTAPRRNRQREFIVGSIVVVAIIVTALVLRPPSAAPQLAISSLAVLPFTNVGNDTAFEYVSEGLSDGLRGALQDPRIRVAARTSSYAFKGKTIDVGSVTRTLNVGAVLTGQLRHVGTLVRASVDLDAADGSSLWHQDIEKTTSNPMDVQAAILNELSIGLHRRLGLVAAAGSKAHRVTDARTLDMYNHGVFLVDVGTERSLHEAVGYFERAIARDSVYAPAFVQLAHAYGQLADGYAAPREVIPQAMRALQRAITLDDSSAAAHAALGTFAEQYQYDLALGGAEFARALELDSDNISAHFWRAVHWTTVGDRGRAVKDLRAALQLDPLSALLNHLAVPYYTALNLPDSAIAQYQRAMGIDSTFFYGEAWVAEAYRLKGDLTTALAIERRTARQIGRPTTGLIITLARLNQRGEALRSMRELESRFAGYRIPELMARAWLVLGDTTRALDYLEQGADKQSGLVCFASRYQEFRGLRGNPRFERYLKRVNLADYVTKS